MALAAPGVGSGLDVNGMVTQLMQVERQPQNDLQQKVQTERAQVSAYGRLTQALDGLRKAANDMTRFDFIPYKAQSSNGSVAEAKVLPGAGPGKHEVEVKQLASTEKLVSDAARSEKKRLGSGNLKIDVGGKTFRVHVSGRKSGLDKVAQSINKAPNNTGVTASVVKGADGAHLILTGDEKAKSQPPVSRALGWLQMRAPKVADAVSGNKTVENLLATEKQVRDRLSQSQVKERLSGAAKKFAGKLPEPRQQGQLSQKRSERLASKMQQGPLSQRLGNTAQRLQDRADTQPRQGQNPVSKTLQRRSQIVSARANAPWRLPRGQARKSRQAQRFMSVSERLAQARASSFFRTKKAQIEGQAAQGLMSVSQRLDGRSSPRLQRRASRLDARSARPGLYGKLWQRLMNTASDSPPKVKVNARDKRGLNFDKRGLSLLDSRNLREESAPQAARLTVDGIEVTSPTNELDRAIPGVSLSLRGEGKTTVTVVQDNKPVTDAVNKFVTGYNDYRKTYDDLKKNELKNDSTIDNVNGQIQSIINTQARGLPYPQLSAIGVQRQRDGSMTVDSNTLDQALAKNFQGVVDLFADPRQGVGTRLGDALLKIVGAEGPVGYQTKTLNEHINSDQQKLMQMDMDLARREQDLRNQYNQMDAAVASARQASGALAQLGGEGAGGDILTTLLASPQPQQTQSPAARGEASQYLGAQAQAPGG